MPTPSLVSSGSPTPSSVSYGTTNNMASIKESFTELEGNILGSKDYIDTKSVFGADTIYQDSDDDDDTLLATSGEEIDPKSIGLFDIVKREFRVRTAVITNKPDHGQVHKKPKINFIQDMKNKVGIAIDHKNRALEEMQNKNLKQATRFFHLALLHIKGLDPDEGVLWSLDFEDMDKDKLPLRVMPSELKEIKEGVEIDCYLGLAGCLQHKERVPYRRIKSYCMRILDFREDYVPALVKCGMACYYLREYELCRFYMQNAKDLSTEPMVNDKFTSSVFGVTLYYNGKIIIRYGPKHVSIQKLKNIFVW
ncbi:uncharacterized protein LOC120326444 isoform X1 [Styela clava]